MKVTTVGERPVTIGWIIALAVGLLAVLFMAIGKLDFVTGGLILALAVSRLL